MREELAPSIVEASCLLHAYCWAASGPQLYTAGQLINSRVKANLLRFDLTPACKRSCAVQYRSELQRSYHETSRV